MEIPPEALHPTQMKTPPEPGSGPPPKPSAEAGLKSFCSALLSVISCLFCIPDIDFEDMNPDHARRYLSQELTTEWLLRCRQEASDPTKERKPPPCPTPVNFPAYGRIPFDANPVFRDLYKLFTSIRKASDVTEDHLKALHLRISENVALEDLIPDAAKYIPPEEWTHLSNGPIKQTSHKETGSDPKIVQAACEGAEQRKGYKLFSERVIELQFENDDAFRAIHRLPPRDPSKRQIRPAHFRKFYNSLDLMSQYWDASLDQYIRDPKTAKDEDFMDVDEPRKRAKLMEGIETREGYTYKGRRLGTGRDMPEHFREDAVKTFVEAIVWAMGCQIVVPRLMPRLVLQNALIPVRATAEVFRCPTDRDRARQGCLDGPVMAIQCRSETGFRAGEGEEVDHDAEKIDLLKEISALLFIAQTRAREHQEEFRPGEGKWWTTKPRWGGGLGGELAEHQGVDRADSLSLRRTRTPVKPGEATRKEKAPKKQREKPKDAKIESWKVLRLGMPLWDPKITYLQIGKDKADEFDNVYLISSINHHMSILRLRVHPLFLDYIRTGIAHPTSPDYPFPAGSSSSAGFSPPSEPSAPVPWYVLDHHRSKWYDLFSREDRIEAMRGIWGIMTYMMREQE